jgi:dephospho-CoA kinase
MLKVGLTGGIASGKSTVAGMLRARGCPVIDADRLAHRLIEPGQPAHAEIVREFGPEVLAAGGGVDRERLAEIVFADRARLARLNAIVHPRVIVACEEEFARLAREQPDAVAVVEAALLVEANYYKQLDALIVTWCPPEQQLERLLAKGTLTREQAEQRLAAQMPPEEKRQVADFVIDTSGPLASVEPQVEAVLAELRRRVRR